jgi:acetyl-CoA acetyltransferase
MLHELKRRAKEGKPAKYGIATLCAAGGQGSALIVERV